MAEVKVAAVPQQSWANPKAAPGSEDPWMVHTPVWHVVIRGFQIFFSIVIVGMAGYLIHGFAMDANSFAVACGVFTWIIVGYALITEKASGARQAYNIWAILALDLFMAIFWLSSMGANAALRASFKTTVQIDSCWNDGSAVSSNHCTILKRDGVAVAGKVGLALMSAIAGLSALNWLLFIATLVFNGHTFRMYYQANKTPKTTENATVEMKAQETPMLDSQQQQQQQQPYPQYNVQQQYQPQVPHPQPTPSPGPVPSQSPAPQFNPAYNYAQPQYHEAPGYQQPQVQQQQQVQQYPAAGYPQAYSPNPTPVQGQPYYPPAQ